jgi:polysaccharide pyruvyl transferase WcaK-like protein
VRVLIDPGSHHLLNVGDVAMLQACLERLRRAWPDARIDVLTAAPVLLEQHCPKARPVPAAGRYEWTARLSAQPRSGRRRLARARTWGECLRLRARRPEQAAFLEALLRADLLLFSGRGGLTDAFADEALAVLLELSAAHDIGLRVAMLGQGMGPLEDRGLRTLASQVLPEVALFGVREPRAAPALLAAAGVPADRVHVTGDDAIELARRAARPAVGTAVGLSMRVAAYSGLTQEEATAIGARVGALAASHGAPLLALPISRHPAEDDAVALARVPSAGSPPDEPLGVGATIERVGSCRVVVAGSYHGAVFALAQGIPAVCVAASPYYVDKFAGLQAQFGRWCRVVQGIGRDPGGAVASTAAALWDEAPAARAELLEAAAGQVACADFAYERLFALGSARGDVSAA